MSLVSSTHSLGRCVDSVFMGGVGRSFHGLANETLLVDRKISGAVVSVVGSGMFRMYVEG